MDYKAKLQLNNNELEGNNIDLQTILDTINALPEAGNGIDTSDATAVADNLLEGKTAYNSSGKITGSMLDRNSVGKNNVVGMNSNYPNTASNPSATNLQMGTNTDGVQRLNVIAPAGYYDGQAYVSIPATSLGTATPDVVKSGYTFTSTSGLNVAGTGNLTNVIISEGTFRTSRGSATVTTTDSNGTTFQPDAVEIFIDEWPEDGDCCTFAAVFNYDSRPRYACALYESSDGTDYYGYCSISRTTTGFKITNFTWWDDAGNESTDSGYTYNYYAVKYT